MGCCSIGALSFRIKWWKVLELNCGDAWTAVQIYLMSLKCTLNAQMMVFIWCICYHRENNNLEKYHCLIYPWITPCWCCALLLLSPLTSGLKYSSDIPTSLNLNSNECYRVSLAISSLGNVTFSIYYLSISLLDNVSHIQASRIHPKGSLIFLCLS